MVMAAYQTIPTWTRAAVSLRLRGVLISGVVVDPPSL